jgi:hypothetical protein
LTCDVTWFRFSLFAISYRVLYTAIEMYDMVFDSDTQFSLGIEYSFGKYHHEVKAKSSEPITCAIAKSIDTHIALSVSSSRGKAEEGLWYINFYN